MRRSQGAKSAGQPTERNAVPAPAKCTSSIAKSAEPPAGFTATARDNEPHDLEAARYSAPASAAAVAESSAAGGQRAGEEAEAARLELRRELAAAVANEDYDEAARIKKRETALELRSELAVAVANEDYDEAARIKKREAALAQ